jgi:hypothetical protein
LYWYWQKPACAWSALNPNATRAAVRDADNVTMKIRILRETPDGKRVFPVLAVIGQGFPSRAVKVRKP